MLFQVGEVESSKSAMNTSAPEFKALIIIFLSTGPVISTFLFVTSFGGGVTFQSPSLIFLSFGKESLVPDEIAFCIFFLFSKIS